MAGWLNSRSSDRDTSRGQPARDVRRDHRDERDNRDHRRNGSRNGNGQRDQHSGRPGHSEHSGGRAIGGSSAVAAAKAILVELTGHPCESVSSLNRRQDGGWNVTLEIVELERIPQTTDILASYVVELDDRGELLSYQRVNRYYRNAASGGDE